MNKIGVFKIMSISSLLFMTCFLSAQEHDLTVAFRIKTKLKSDQFPFILTNKAWEEGEVKDFTSNHQLGKSRTTKTLQGWCIGLQENGSWFFNIGADTELPLDYHPTFAKQPLADGKWHHLGFSINSVANEAWLYYDGQLKAVLSFQEVNNNNLSCFTDSAIRTFQREKTNPLYGKAALRDLTISKKYLPERLFKQQFFASHKNITDQYKRRSLTDSLHVLAWNIWHGGRRDGLRAGLERVVDIIKEARANIILMVETYGSGAVIGDSLGYIYYRRSNNLSIFSPFKIVNTYGFYDPFRFGGLMLDLGDHDFLRVFCLWIHYLPDLRPLFEQRATVNEILTEENKTRGKEITEIMQLMGSISAEADSIPVIIGGDFNSASHFDWGYNTKDSPHHYGYVIPWPESIIMTREGYTDSYRFIHPDPFTSPGLTWSPRFTESRQERIDYIYFKGEKLHCLSSQVLSHHQPRWPSDHAAVLSQFYKNK